MQRGAGVEAFVRPTMQRRAALEGLRRQHGAYSGPGGLEVELAHGTGPVQCPRLVVVQ